MSASAINILDKDGAAVALDSELISAKETPQHGVRDGMDEALGAKADTAATTDTGTFSLIALTKRLLTKLPGLGPQTSANSIGVTLSAEDVAIIGDIDADVPGSDTAGASLNGRLQRIAQRITSLIALFPTSLGVKSAATSFSVTRSTEDVAQIGGLTESAPGTDTASSGLNGRLQRIAQRITSLIALLPASLGSKAASASLAVTQSTEDAALIGGLTESAPGTDTASSGLNGRLQRIAQRLSSLIALVPSSLGAKNAVASFSVVLAVDQPTIKTVARFLTAVGTTLTRPANTTPYSIGESISNNATAGSVTALSFNISDANDQPVTLERCRVVTNDTGIGANNVGLRAYFYNSDPTASSGVGAGDNAAFSNKRAGFIGTMSGVFRAFSDGGVAILTPDEGARIITAPGSGARTVWVQYQILTAATPSANSTTLIPTLEGFQGV